MPCDTVRTKWNQTQEQRNEEIKDVIERVTRGLVDGTITAVVGPQGGVAFQGIPLEMRGDITDVCIYRRLMVTGDTLALHSLRVAEAMAGRTIENRAVEQGWHLHGSTWHPGH